MKNNTVQLVASDIDGTLLQGGAQEISPEVFAQIRRLRRHGIRFCSASGRQYTSLRRLFAPVADDISYVCENGAIVYHEGRVLFKLGFARADAERLIGEILAQSDCEVMISGANTCYLMPKSEEYLAMMTRHSGNHIRVVQNTGEVDEQIIKISAYCRGPGGAAAREVPLGAPWKDKCNVAVAGERWLDFTESDKGRGLSALCGALGVDMRRVAAFGDNYNDLPMLRRVGWPYLMAGGVTPAQARLSAPVAGRVQQVLAAL